MSNLMRNLLRAASRNRVIRKRFPADLGRGFVYCSPEAMLSVWKPGWRSAQAIDLMQWARRLVKPSMCVWDLGANQGIFSFAASAQAGGTGNVVAFEPDPFMLNLMRRSVATGSHRGAPVRILPMAVGSGHCIAEFLIASSDRALNHLREARGNPRTGGARDTILVPCASLDWLVDQLPRPDLLKIDIEGAELLALRSGERMLREVRPILIIETAPENASEIGQILTAYDYCMSDVNDPLEVQRATPAWNTLARPRAKQAALMSHGET